MATIDETTHPGWTPAAALAAGKTHLRVVCLGCRMITYPTWRMMHGLPLDAPMRETAARLICERCGRRPTIDDLSAYAIGDAKGYVSSYRA